MSIFRRDSTGDLDRGPRGIGFSRVSGQEEARTRLETVLRLVQPEVKRDTRAGLDQEYLLDPGVPNRLKANHIAAVAVGVPGITDAQIGFELTPESGRLDVTGDVQYNEADQEGRTLQAEQILVSAGADIGGTAK